MAVQLMCDYCGHPIAGDRYVKVNALGREAEAYGSSWEMVNEFLGHFHADQDNSCYSDFREQVALVLNTHQSLNGGQIHEGATLAGGSLEMLQTERQRDSMIARRRRHEAPQAASHEPDPKWDRHRERQLAWTSLSVGQRCDAFLRCLGGESLTGAEVAARLNAELGYDADEGDVVVVHVSEMRRLAQRLVQEGRLDQATENFRNNLRYRYTAKTEAVA